MNKLQSAIALLLMSLPLFVAAQDKVGAEAPVNTVNTIWVMVFVVLFIVTCVGFFAYIWLKDGKSEQAGPDK